MLLSPRDGAHWSVGCEPWLPGLIICGPVPPAPTQTLAWTLVPPLPAQVLGSLPDLPAIPGKEELPAGLRTAQLPPEHEKAEIRGGTTGLPALSLGHRPGSFPPQPISQMGKPSPERG